MKSVRAALLFICFTVFTTGVLAAGMARVAVGSCRSPAIAAANRKSIFT